MPRAFDMLEAIHRLEATGMDREQAEAVADTASAAAGADMDRFATKAVLKAEVAALETRIGERLNALTWRMVALAGVVVAAIKLIPGGP